MGRHRRGLRPCKRNPQVPMRLTCGGRARGFRCYRRYRIDHSLGSTTREAFLGAGDGTFGESTDFKDTCTTGACIVTTHPVADAKCAMLRIEPIVRSKESHDVARGRGPGLHGRGPEGLREVVSPLRVTGISELPGRLCSAAAAELSWKRCPLRWDRPTHCSFHQRLLGPAQYH
jgi:hypothetical protein